MKRLFGMLAAGLLLWLVSDVWAGASDRRLVVAVSPEAHDALVEQHVEDAILVAEARLAGWHETDPVVRRHLAARLSSVRPDASPDARLAEALALDIGAHDPVVRQRLMDRARRALASVDASPSRSVLQKHLEAHAEDFTGPDRLHLAHVIWTHARHGEAAMGRAQDADLPATVRTEADVAHFGDPAVGRRPLAWTHAAREGSTWGTGVAERVATLPVGAWSAPVASDYGVHRFYLVAREHAELPSLDDVHAQVLAHWTHATRQARIDAGLAELRQAWDVQVVRR